MSIYMQRCLDLAAKALGNVAPNPLVGALLVHEGRVIGEGYHEQYGKAHAEVNALASVLPEDRWRLPEATLYVSLEPCSHFGKTPPCTHAIVQAGVRRVVVAMSDPFPLVAGKGIHYLREAGIEVIVGDMEAEARYLNRRFLTYHEQKRPYIILKWAQTQNAYFAPLEAQQTWISNALTQTVSHRWRTEEQAILVGSRTAAIDNPQLTPRYWTGSRQALRIVIDRSLQLPKTLHLFDESVATWVLNECTDNTSSKNLQYIRLNFEDNILLQLLQKLYAAQLQSLIVEGGKQLLDSFIAAGCWDEARLFIGSSVWKTGIVAPNLLSARRVGAQVLADNILEYWERMED